MKQQNTARVMRAALCPPGTCSELLIKALHACRQSMQAVRELAYGMPSACCFGTCSQIITEADVMTAGHNLLYSAHKPSQAMERLRCASSNATLPCVGPSRRAAASRATCATASSALLHCLGLLFENFMAPCHNNSSLGAAE